MAREISDSDFQVEVEQAKELVLVDFWAPWCPPCRALAPIFDKLSQKYPAIKFLKVNTDENQQKAGQYGVSGIPCIIIFKEGKEVDRLVGFRPEADFEASIKKHSH